MAVSYLHNPNNLIVQVAPKSSIGGDFFFTYGSLRATFDMTGKDLKKAALNMWSLEEPQAYKLVRIVQDGVEVEIDDNKTLAEMGINNGAPIQIVEI